jgi:hypothetical protein
MTEFELELSMGDDKSLVEDRVWAWKNDCLLTGAIMMECELESSKAPESLLVDVAVWA